jgi:AcrR family transcriptional regulator
MKMPRHPDPLRKPQLLAEILEYLLDKPLASVSFRTIAAALNVSTYTLVYQFGTRAQLLSEIVSAVSTRAGGIEQRLRDNPGTLDVYFDGLVMSWEWTREPRNRQLQRLEFEAALIEAVQPDDHTFTRALYATWQRIGRDALVSLGLSESDADLETRLIVDTFYGIQYDFVLNHDAARATAVFERAMQQHRERIEALAAAAPPAPGMTESLRG